MTTDWSDVELADKLVRLNIVHNNMEELDEEHKKYFLMHLGARALSVDPEYYFFLVDRTKKEMDDSQQALPSDPT